MYKKHTSPSFFTHTISLFSAICLLSIFCLFANFVKNTNFAPLYWEIMRPFREKGLFYS